MEHTIIQTADGSHSLYVKHLDEHYHSIHGAIQESKHVFIETGFRHFLSQTNSAINILEIGFGTGLNALLTYMEAERLDKKINYTSLEAYPLDMKLITELNYITLLADTSSSDNQDLKSKFELLHSSDWEKENFLSETFSLRKIKNTLQEIRFDNTFDLIYFDAFGPRVQPEMWTEELFKKIFTATNPNGSLVTYCAKGEVKRTLKKVGFIVETLPGPPGKREMVRGRKLP